MNCAEEQGHVWERVTKPRAWNGEVSATVACVREGCDEVAVEIFDNVAQNAGQS